MYKLGTHFDGIEEMGTYRDFSLKDILKLKAVKLDKHGIVRKLKQHYPHFTLLYTLLLGFNDIKI